MFAIFLNYAFVFCIIYLQSMQNIEYKYPYSEIFFFFLPEAASTICSQEEIRVWKDAKRGKKSNDKVKLAIRQKCKSRISFSSTPKGATKMT